MKVGDLVNHRNGGPRSVLGGGLIIRMRMMTVRPGVDVLWSKTGKVRWHGVHELRVLHEAR